MIGRYGTAAMLALGMIVPVAPTVHAAQPVTVRAMVTNSTVYSGYCQVAVTIRGLTPNAFYTVAPTTTSTNPYAGTSPRGSQADATGVLVLNDNWVIGPPADWGKPNVVTIAVATNPGGTQVGSTTAVNRCTATP